MLLDKLDNIDKKLKDGTIGLEHIFRELGQYFECMPQEERARNKLPNVVADLLLIGIPFEIMDGDVSHVPLVWINAVFDELTKKLGKNCRIFVQSILGIQSSGKSTFLNMMYGLNFAVSSGRCTRGAFAQLLPVKDGCQKAIGYDYFLVVDTEGLRSPVSPSPDHGTLCPHRPLGPRCRYTSASGGRGTL